MRTSNLICLADEAGTGRSSVIDVENCELFIFLIQSNLIQSSPIQSNPIGNPSGSSIILLHVYSRFSSFSLCIITNLKGGQEQYCI